MRRSVTNLHFTTPLQPEEDLHLLTAPSEQNSCVRCRVMEKTARPTQRAANRICSPLLWLSTVLLLALLPCHVQAGEDPPGFNPYQCSQAFDTSAQISYVCGSHPDLFPILNFAEVVAREECERAFRMEEWNCSEFSLLKAPKIASDANKEAAYVHALSVAAIAHTVAKACKDMGDSLQSCSCDSDPDLDYQVTSTVTYTTECSDNVDFGVEFAEAFLNKRYEKTGHGHKEDLDQHNIEAGTIVVHDVMENTPAVCTCHGVSGACTFQTCYGELPEFQYLGERIKELYDSACRVESNSLTGEHFAWIPQCDRPVKEKDLIYNRNSPNYCIRDPTYGTLGVKGRECNPHSSGPDSCHNLCVSCGRNFQEQLVHEERQCNCQFQYCCEIICDTCTNSSRVYRCT